MLLDLEQSTGLAERSEGERNLLAALLLCGGLNGRVRPAQLKQHPLIADLTHPTYHRILRNLLDGGLIEYAPAEGEAKGYRIVPSKVQARAQDPLERRP